MIDPAQAMAVLAVLSIAGAAVIASLAMLVLIARRLYLGRPVLPREPRRLVPWGAFDVFIVAAVYVGSIVAVAYWDSALFGPLPERPPALAEGVAAQGDGEQAAAAKEGKRPKTDLNHPLIVLIRQDPSLTTFLLALAAAVVMAPIVEEFLFRLVLQGWLEALEIRLRWILGLRGVLLGVAPVLAASLVFAALHYREAREPEAVEFLTRMLGRTVVAGLWTLLLAVPFLRLRAGATAEDFGIVPEKLWSDIRLGLLAFLTIAAPIYALQVLVLPKILPEHIAPDPITLTLFAIILGTLYCRTHRIVPAITLHMALNATSLLLAWLTLPLAPA